MSSNMKALARMVMLSGGALSLMLGLTWLPSMAMAGEAETDDGQVSDAEYQKMTKEEKKKTAIQDMKNAMKGEVLEELTVGVAAVASLGYHHSFHKYQLVSQEEGQEVELNNAIVAQLKKDQYTLGDEYETLQAFGVGDVGIKVNAKLFDFLTPSTTFYIRKDTSSFEDGKWNTEDLPTFGVELSPHYFKPIQYDTLWKLLGIDSKRNLGSLSYGFDYSFGYFYNPTGEDQLGGTVSFGVSHSNFDPLGPIQIYNGYQVRGTISSGFGVSAQHKTLTTPSDWLAGFSTSPSIRFSKTFDTGSLIALGFYTVVGASRISLYQFDDFDVFKARTYQYQKVQLAYQKVWTRLSRFSVYASLFRDYSPPMFAKKPFDPSGHIMYSLRASFSWETG